MTPADCMIGSASDKVLQSLVESPATIWELAERLRFLRVDQLRNILSGLRTRARIERHEYVKRVDAAGRVRRVARWRAVP